MLVGASRPSNKPMNRPANQDWQHSRLSYIGPEGNIEPANGQSAQLLIGGSYMLISKPSDWSCPGLAELPGGRKLQHVAAGWDVAVACCEDSSVYVCCPSRQAQHPGEQWTEVQFPEGSLVTAVSAGEKHRCVQNSCLSVLFCACLLCGGPALS